jgi:hypothetical protein
LENSSTPAPQHFGLRRWGVFYGRISDLIESTVVLMNVSSMLLTVLMTVISDLIESTVVLMNVYISSMLMTVLMNVNALMNVLRNALMTFDVNVN